MVYNTINGQAPTLGVIGGTMVAGDLLPLLAEAALKRLIYSFPANSRAA